MKVERELDEANKCFICGVEEQYFLKHSTHITDGSGNEGFKNHRRVTHDMWNYLYFAMKIWQQPRDLDNSVEMHIRSCMERGDISWFPIGIFNSELNINNAAMGGMHEGDGMSTNNTLAIGDMNDSKSKTGMGGGGGGASPASPRRRNSDHNLHHHHHNNNHTHSALLHDFARLEETFTQKLNTLGDNIATLASYSVQNTLDDNHINLMASTMEQQPPLENKRSLRSSILAVNSSKKRESMLNKSKRDTVSGSSKIAVVVDQVRAAMSEAVFKRQQAQRNLADLEENMNKDGNITGRTAMETNTLTVVTSNSEEPLIEEQHEQQQQQQQQKGEDSQYVEEMLQQTPPDQQLAMSPSSRMLSMMRTCFQQELAPLKSQMEDLSLRVGQLETDKAQVLHAQTMRKDSFDDPVEDLDVSTIENSGQMKLSPLEENAHSQKSKSNTRKTVGDTKAKDPNFTAKVHFKGELNPLGEGKKGTVKSKTTKKDRDGYMLSKHNQKKADLKHAYVDDSKARVRTAPTARRQSPSITRPASSSHTNSPNTSASTTTPNTTTPPAVIQNMQRETDRLRNVQAATSDFERMKEDEVIDVEVTSSLNDM